MTTTTPAPSPTHSKRTSPASCGTLPQLPHPPASNFLKTSQTSCCPFSLQKGAYSHTDHRPKCIYSASVIHIICILTAFMCNYLHVTALTFLYPSILFLNTFILFNSCSQLLINYLLTE